MYAIKYDTKMSEKSVINLSGIKDGEYYFLYVKTDDENGKYVSNEAVTLAQASVIDSSKWWMFFYGSSDFKWADFGNVSTDKEPSKDQSTAPGVLPQTGLIVWKWAIVGVIIVGVGTLSYSQYKKNNF